MQTKKRIWNDIKLQKEIQILILHLWRERGRSFVTRLDNHAVNPKTK